MSWGTREENVSYTRKTRTKIPDTTPTNVSGQSTREGL